MRGIRGVIGGNRWEREIREKWLLLIDSCDLAAYLALGGIHWSFGMEMHRKGRVGDQLAC
jgi:hypothetical protein